MSKIIGVTVGTTINPSKFGALTDEKIESAVNKYLEENPSGGVTDYLDLTNKPITYLPLRCKCDFTEEGIYIEEYSADDMNKHQRIILVNRSGKWATKYTMDVDGYEYMTCDTDTGEWSDPIKIDYLIKQEPMYMLWGNDEGDGLVSYYPEIGTKSFAQISADCKFILPEIQAVQGSPVHSDILVDAQFTDAVVVDWGDVLFYNNEIPIIKEGCCDIIFTFSVLAQKWTVGILEKGAVE